MFCVSGNNTTIDFVKYYYVSTILFCLMLLSFLNKIFVFLIFYKGLKKIGTYLTFSK